MSDAIASTETGSPQATPAAATAAPQSTDVAPPSTQAAPASSPDRPSWLPEQFATAEDMAKAYAELERGQSDGQPTDQPSGASSTTRADVPTNHSDAAVMVESAGLDFTALNTEFTQNGSLSAKSYADLARAGIDRVTVDGYISGQQALADGIRNAVFDAAGGPDAYADMVAWAAHAFSDSDRESFNSTMNSGQTHQMRLAVDGLKARFIAEHGTPPTQLIGGSSGRGAGGGEGFSSTKELTAAMSDPRYASDPGYRQSVIDKLSRSNIL